MEASSAVGAYFFDGKMPFTSARPHARRDAPVPAVYNSEWGYTLKDLIEKMKEAKTEWDNLSFEAQQEAHQQEQDYAIERERRKPKRTRLAETLRIKKKADPPERPQGSSYRIKTRYQALYRIVAVFASYEKFQEYYEMVTENPSRGWTGQMAYFPWGKDQDSAVARLFALASDADAALAEAQELLAQQKACNDPRLEGTGTIFNTLDETGDMFRLFWSKARDYQAGPGTQTHLQEVYFKPDVKLLRDWRYRGLADSLVNAVDRGHILPFYHERARERIDHSTDSLPLARPSEPRHHRQHPQTSLAKSTFRPVSRRIVA